jgi:hypothetical protein
MFTIPSHKGNANQNHTKIPPHTKISPQHHVLVRMWGKRNPLTLLVEMQAGETTLEKNLEAS